MRLSSIKLAGFKSFVEPTKIPFPDQMTCVVGPNGCGKSNVIDAVRWVLGESSAKNLRGDAMTDVIFNGSTNRKPVSQGSVELLFDNTKGALPGTLADRNQVAIKRLVTRDGQSTYFLNGSKCRRRDITDIFLGTGLGPRSYAIIEQGMISRLIESKPAELRVFIEEAAGVSKYKERRRETETRIRSTRDNLERLLDMRQELHNQLEKLELQAGDATRYRTLKAEERTLKGQLAVLKWQDFNLRQQKKREQIDNLQQEIDFLERSHSGNADVLASLELEVANLNDQLQDTRQQAHQTDNQLTRAEQEAVHARRQQGLLQGEIAQLRDELQELEAAFAVQQAHTQALNEQSQSAEETLSVSEQQVEQASEQYEAERLQSEQLIDNWQQLQDSLHQAEKKYQQITHQADSHKAAAVRTEELLAEREQQLQQLKDKALDRALETLQSEIKTLRAQLAEQQSAQSKKQTLLATETTRLDEQKTRLAASERRVTELKATHSTLQSLTDNESQGEAGLLTQLRVTPGFEEKIERTLGEFSRLYALSGTADAAQADERAVIWPAEDDTEQGRAESLSRFIEKGLFPDWLHRIAFARDEKSLSFLDDPYWLAVMDESGVLHGRHWRLPPDISKGQGELVRRRRLEELGDEIAEAESEQKTILTSVESHRAMCDELIEDISVIKERVHELAKDNAAYQTRLSLLEHECENWRQHMTSLAGELNRLTELQNAQQTELAQYLQQCDNEADALEQLKEQVASSQADQQRAREQLQQLSFMLERCKNEQHTARIKLETARGEQTLCENKLQHITEQRKRASARLGERQEQLEALIEPLEEWEMQIALLLEQKEDHQGVRLALEGKLTEAKQALADKQAGLLDAGQKVDRIRQQLTQYQLDEQGLMIKAQAALEPLLELEQNLKQVLAELPEDAEATRWQNRLGKISQQVAALGAVNLAAIDEYSQAKERKEYLDAQLNDLTEALSTLEGAIAKIDTQTRSRFKSTFERVNADLGELFPKVFGGGHAYLELTSDDLLESGVAIMARPPGKKNSTIHLLSGGEKALTALSLVFSIFRLNPAPFCMLDEVDAPLDDANVGRFCRLVEEMSQTVQFIYISHNKIAMEMAGRLTGVTMAEPGVSRMVAVDIDKALEMAQAN